MNGVLCGQHRNVTFLHPLLPALDHAAPHLNSALTPPPRSSTSIHVELIVLNPLSITLCPLHPSKLYTIISAALPAAQASTTKVSKLVVRGKAVQLFSVTLVCT